MQNYLKNCKGTTKGELFYDILFFNEIACMQCSLSSPICLSDLPLDWRCQRWSFANLYLSPWNGFYVWLKTGYVWFTKFQMLSSLTASFIYILCQALLAILETFRIYSPSFHDKLIVEGDSSNSIYWVTLGCFFQCGPIFHFYLSKIKFFSPLILVVFKHMSQLVMG